MSDKNNKSEQLNILLQALSSRLGTNPKELKSAAEQGNINNLLKGLHPDDAEKIQKVLSDKDAAQKILSSAQAQKLMKKFLGDK